MKVAILSYPMLFQLQGGLQIQIKETISELNQLGIQAKLINPVVDKLNDYDLVHVFSAINGNHRLVEAAKGFTKPVVISPLIQPDWTWFTGVRECFLDRLVGKLSGWHIKTTYQEIDYCLQESDFIVALGDREKRSIVDAFAIDSEKIKVIPNGIPLRFFEATPNIFFEKYSLETDFVLCVAAINSHKNQLSLVQAIQDLPYKVILIGQCLESDKDYLAQIEKFPNVIYLGAMEYHDPLLASAYAAAKVFCLPSNSEVMPLCVLEALAAGTPAVMTKYHSMDTSKMIGVIKEVDPKSCSSIKNSIEDLLSTDPIPKYCKDVVADLNWRTVAQEIATIYRKVLGIN